MGNRTERGYIPEVINSRNFANGYAHILPNAEGEGYRYISNLATPVLKAGHYDSSHGFSLETFAASFLQTGELEIPLLPAITVVPPPEIPSRDLVKEKIVKARDEILGLVRPETNIITCSHGSYWWFLPEEQIKKLLESEGFSINSYFPRVGGRKRIQEHALLLSWH